MENGSTQSTYAPAPGHLTETISGKLLLGFAATLVVALAAHISFPLPFTVVPLTLQPLAVLGVGLAFGPVGGFLIMMAYLAEGAAGLPVFSPAGIGGVAHLSFRDAWSQGVLPFLPGEAVKILAASGIYSALARRQGN